MSCRRSRRGAGGSSRSFAEVAGDAGYGEVITPLLEDYGVFARVGDATDLVQKEMYRFTDNGGRDVALRPEFTAAVCRAFVEHRPATPWKVWCGGTAAALRAAPARPLPPVRPGQPRGARQQRPAGRRRGDRPRVAVLRAARSAQGDAARQLARHAGGAGPLHRGAAPLLHRQPRRPVGPERDDARPQPAARARLEAARGRRADRRRADRSPTRYGAATTAHFEAVCAGLELVGVPVHDRPAARPRSRLLRQHDVRVRRRNARQRPERARRRRPLRRPRRGARRPADSGIGFALGVDRTLLACDDEGVFDAPAASVDVFVVDTTGGAAALGDHRGAAPGRASAPTGPSTGAA